MNTINLIIGIGILLVLGYIGYISYIQESFSNITIIKPSVTTDKIFSFTDSTLNIDTLTLKDKTGSPGSICFNNPDTSITDEDAKKLCINVDVLQKIKDISNKNPTLIKSITSLKNLDELNIQDKIPYDEYIGKKEINWADNQLWPVGTILPLTLIEGQTKLDIPNNWKLCDGKNFTPDLTGRFVLGANYDPNNPYPDYGPLWTGGSESVELTNESIPKHSHNLEVNSGGGSGDRGVIKIGKGCSRQARQYREAAPKDASGKYKEPTLSDPLPQSTNSDYAYLGPSGTVGKATKHNNLPPYFKVVYIIYVGDDDSWLSDTNF